MSYTPPPYNQIGFAFGNGGYTPPPHDEISLAFGVPPGYLLGIGWNDLLAGTPMVSLLNRDLAPSGWDALALGTAAIRNQVQPVSTTGINDLVFGTAFVSHLNRTIAPAGIKIDAYGAPMLGGGIREVAALGLASEAFGAAMISIGLRELFPLWWFSNIMGVPTVGYHRDVAPAGWDSSIFGALSVRDNRQYAAPTGWDSLHTGLPFVASRVRRLLATTIEAGDFDRWSRPKIHNETQYIQPEYAQSRWIEGGFGDEQIMWIRNVNRVLDLVGNGIKPPFRGVSPFGNVRNAARILAAAGLIQTLWGNNQAAHRVRSVFPQGIDSFRFDRFTNVYNAAHQILPAGIGPAAFGLAALLNTRRWITYAGGIGAGALGLPFVAPRLRELAPTSLAAPGGRIGAATVWDRVRTLAPLAPPFGWGGYFGIASLSIHQNIVQANSITPIDGVSTGARLNNVTPQIYPHWSTADFTQWGSNAIRNQYEPCPVSGWDAFVAGSASVDFRTKTVLAPGFDALRPNNLHRVRNVIPDPPGVQYAAAVTMGVQTGFPDPIVHANSLYPEGISASLFGVGLVYSTGISPVSIIPPFDEDAGGQVGIPSLNADQTIGAATIGFTEEFGIPRFSPYTIWAPQGAPDQAKTNHPPGREEQIDAFLDTNNLVRPLFGHPGVELQNRSVAAGTIGDAASFGIADLTEKPIYVGPSGIKAAKYGFPTLNGGGLIEVYNIDAPDAFGEASIAAVEPFIRHLRPGGMVALGFGQPWVANFHRQVPVSGIDALLVGSHTVQRPPPPAAPPGFIATQWGDALVDYRIRHLRPEGDDTLLMIYELGFFADRMRVSGQTGIVATLGDQLQVGTAHVQRADRDLVAVGIKPPMQQVPAPTMRLQNRVNVPGNGPYDVWGELWALPVTPGTVEPRGDDTSSYGRATMAHRVSGGGWDAFVAGQHAVRHFIGVPGTDTSQFGAVTMIGFGCGARVRVMTGWDALAFGQATVAH